MNVVIYIALIARKMAELLEFRANVPPEFDVTLSIHISDKVNIVQ